MVEIYNKQIENYSGTEWLRITQLGNGLEKIETLHDFTGMLSEADVIKQLDESPPTPTISST